MLILILGSLIPLRSPREIEKWIKDQQKSSPNYTTSPFIHTMFKRRDAMSYNCATFVAEFLKFIGVLKDSKLRLVSPKFFQADDSTYIKESRGFLENNVKNGFSYSGFERIPRDFF